MTDSASEEGLEKPAAELQAIVDALSQGFYESELRCLAVQIKKWNERSRVRLGRMLSKLPNSAEILRGLGLPADLQDDEDAAAACAQSQPVHNGSNPQTSPVEKHAKLDQHAREGSERSLGNRASTVGQNGNTPTPLRSKREWERLEAEQSALQNTLRGMQEAQQVRDEEMQQQKNVHDNKLQEMQRQSESDGMRFQEELDNAVQELKKSHVALEQFQQQKKYDHDKLKEIQRQLDSDHINFHEELRTARTELSNSSSALVETQQQRQCDHDKFQEIEKQWNSERNKFQQELCAASQELKESQLALAESQRSHAEDVSLRTRFEAEKQQLILELSTAADIEQAKSNASQSQLQLYEEELRHERLKNEEQRHQAKSVLDSMEMQRAGKLQMLEKYRHTQRSVREFRESFAEMKQLVSASAVEQQALLHQQSGLIEHRCAAELVSARSHAEACCKLSSEVSACRSDVETFQTELINERALQSHSIKEMEQLRIEMEEAQSSGMDNVALLEHLQDIEEQHHQALACGKGLEAELHQTREAEAAQHDQDLQLQLELRHEHHELQASAELREFELRAEVDELKALQVERARNALVPALPSHLSGTEHGSMVVQRGQRGFGGFSNRPLLRRPASGGSSRPGGLAASGSAPSLFPGSTDGNFNPEAFGNKQQLARSPMLSLVRKGSPHRLL